MPASYVVRRGDAYHFRLRVPADLVCAVGSRELHSSLGHARRKGAEQRAAFLAFHAHAFFGTIRRLMRTMTPDEIAALVDDWRRRMFERDGEVRRLIRLDMHATHDRVSYANQCDAAQDRAEEAANELSPTDEPGDVMRHPSKREQAHALGFARDWLVNDDDAAQDVGHVPLMSLAEFEALDAVTAKDVAWHFLRAAAGVYGRKSAMGFETGGTVPKVGTGTAQAPAAAAGGHAATVSVASTTQVAAPGVAPAATPAATQVTIGEAWTAYCAESVRSKEPWKRAGGPPDNARKAWPTFAEVMGADSPLNTITLASMRRYRSIAEAMPRRDRKPYKDMPLKAVVALAEQGTIPETDRLTTSTLQNLTSEIRAFVVDFCTMEYGLQIPAAFKFKPVGKPKGKGRATWSPDDIKMLFDPATMGAYARKRRESVLRSVNPRTTYRDGAQWADWPWLLLLGLYTGARRSELVGLAACDVLAVHPETHAFHGVDVPVLQIDENEHRELKTDVSARCVPIHPDLVAMGFLELAEQRKARGTARLLDTVGEVEAGGGKASEAFTEYAMEIGARQEGEDKVFHSFRHSFKTQALGVMPADHADDIVGHKGASKAPGTYKHGLKIPQHERADSIAKMTFGLDVEGLRVMLAELQAEVGR